MSSEGTSHFQENVDMLKGHNPILILALNRLTAIRVPARSKNSCPVGFLL
jgi:hypothetical protein